MAAPSQSIEMAISAWRDSEREAPRRIHWLRSIVSAVLVLNLFDGLLTLVWVQLGVATEANVLLTDLLEGNAVTFMAAKLALVSLGVGLLWRLRARPLAVFGMLLAFMAYLSIAVYHLRVAAVAVDHVFG